MTEESSKQTIRNGVVCETKLVVCLTWLDTFFEYKFEDPKNGGFKVMNVTFVTWLEITPNNYDI